MLKSKKAIIVISIATSVALMAMVPEKSSSGAPASHTGAPGEQSCATVGCHDDNSINSGTASLTIDMGAVTKYTANQTYPVKIRITDPGVTRFGFQIVALANSDSTNIGAFQITDPLRTQMAQNQLQLLGRRYVTYTFNGTDAISTGTGEWTVNWTAPSANAGPVTFYAAAVSANDDMTDKGDHVYTETKTITGK